MKVFKLALFIFSAILIIAVTAAFSDNESPYWIVYKIEDAHNEIHEVHRMAADGSDDRVLTDQLAPYTVPKWSPDGKWIAFAMDFQDGSRTGHVLYRMRPDGSDLQAINVRYGTIGYIEWSPDSQWIAFGGIDGAELAYYNRVVSLDGEQEVDLAYRSVDPLKWSPDSEHLIFVLEGYHSIIVQMPIFSSEFEALTSTDMRAQLPQYSPDGEWIALVVLEDGEKNLYRMRPDGADIQQLTHSMIDIESFDWSPDSQHITFENFTGEDDRELYVIDADGSNQRLLYQALGLFTPLWSPDGEWIVFDLVIHIGEYQYNVDIYRIRPDGSDVAPITSGPAYESNPDFSPILEPIAPNKGLFGLEVGVMMLMLLPILFRKIRS